MPRSLNSNSKKSNKKALVLEEAPDIERRVQNLLREVDLEWIEEKRIFCFRSFNSKARARARIWGLSRIFQEALSIKPAYVIEVLSERFDNLSKVEQDKILLHEIAHIPKTFSGSLLPHKKKGNFKFEDKVENLIARYLKKTP